MSVESLVVFQHQAGAWIPCGLLTRTGPDWPPKLRGARFTYGRRYLARRDAVAIDPINLPLVDLAFDTREAEQLHGAFRDASPDGWGKALLQRQYPGGRMGDFEFLAASGSDRTGALAFGLSPQLGPTALDPDGRPQTRPTDIGLQQAFDAAVLTEEHEELPAALVPYLRSASLGGGRPKFSIEFEGKAWIAKFPTRDDQFDVSAVEAAVLDIAQDCGIETPDHRLVRLPHVLGGGERSVLLVERFDRVAGGARLGMLSAETVLKVPPDQFYAGKSYADLAAGARLLGGDAADQVYRRMLLNVLSGNVDDHLRNHAYIRDPAVGWKLSPVYDVVPQPGMKRQMVCRLATGFEVSLQDAVAAAPQLNLPVGRAEQAVGQVTKILEGWTQYMVDRGVSAGEIQFLRPAFEQVGKPYATATPRGAKPQPRHRPRPI